MSSQGFPTPPPPSPYGGASLPTGKATAALVCGILSIIILGVVLGPIAIILGTTAKNDPNQGGDGLARAGIVTGIIGVVGWLLAIIFLL